MRGEMRKDHGDADMIAVYVVDLYRQGVHDEAELRDIVKLAFRLY